MQASSRAHEHTSKLCPSVTESPVPSLHRPHTCQGSAVWGRKGCRCQAESLGMRQCRTINWAGWQWDGHGLCSHMNSWSVLKKARRFLQSTNGLRGLEALSSSCCSFPHVFSPLATPDQTTRLQIYIYITWSLRSGPPPPTLSALLENKRCLTVDLAFLSWLSVHRKARNLTNWISTASMIKWDTGSWGIILFLLLHTLKLAAEHFWLQNNI